MSGLGCRVEGAGACLLGHHALHPGHHPPRHFVLPDAFVVHGLGVVCRIEGFGVQGLGLVV